LSPFRIEEKDQILLSSTTKKAEYAISITNRREKNNLGYGSILYWAKNKSFKRRGKPGYSYHFIS
jgi:hypothetical protein